MTEYKRNIAVGVTAAVAMCGLAYMIMLFGDTQILARRGYIVTIHFPKADTLDRGADVRLNGIRAGTVREIELRPDPRQGVAVKCLIRPHIRIPTNTAASITRVGLGSGAMLALAAKATDGPLKYLPDDGSAVLVGTADGMGGMLGDEAMAKLDRMVSTFDSVRQLADNLNAMAGDEQNQANVRQTLANLREGSAAAVATAAEIKTFAAEARQRLAAVDRTAGAITRTAESAEKHMDTLAAQLIADADQLGRLLTQLNQTAATLNSTRGSAGKMLNDPKLYENMLESIEMLTNTLGEVQATLKTWRDAGVKLKL